MTAFVIALVGGVVVAAVYITLAVQDIRRLRTAGAEPAGVVGGSDGFTWKAGIGVVLSVLLLVGISVASAVWYVLPFLAIGSAIAVIAAFLEEA
jgi:hypothetical protein